MSSAGSPRRRVLVLDDDDRFRAALVDLLTDDDRVEVVASVGDGASALSAAVALAPDVALVDVRLPGVDGPEVTRRLRASCPGLRVFGLSAFADAANRTAMQAAGAERYFVKGGSEYDVLEALVAGTGDGVQPAADEARA